MQRLRILEIVHDIGVSRFYDNINTKTFFRKIIRSSFQNEIEFILDQLDLTPKEGSITTYVMLDLLIHAGAVNRSRILAYITQLDAVPTLIKFHGNFEKITMSGMLSTSELQQLVNWIPNVKELFEHQYLFSAQFLNGILRLSM